MTSSWCHQMCMNEKVNRGPLYDINVWCNRSFKTKLHPIIVRQYSHLKHLFLSYHETEIWRKSVKDQVLVLFVDEGVSAPEGKMACIHFGVYSYSAFK